MKPVWLGSYPPGVIHEPAVDAYRSITEVFEQAVASYPHRIAFRNLGSALTYAQLQRACRAFAAFLQHDLGLHKGARVALMMPNLLQYPIAMFGALAAGCTVVNCNPQYTARELEHQLVDSGAEALVVSETSAAVVQHVIARTAVRHVVSTRLGDMLGPVRGLLVDLVARHVKHVTAPWRIDGAITFNDALRRGARRAPHPVDVGPQDVAFLQYTGGTTGVAKGAMLTHRNIVANMQQGHAWLKPVLAEGRETIVTALPLYHIFALTVNCLVFCKIGATNILVTNPRDIPGFVRELARQPFTVMTGVNTLFNALLNDPGFGALDLRSLKLCLGGGMAVQRPVAERWKAATGKPIVEAYGLTEASPGVTINPLDLEEFNGSAGLPMPGTEIAIRDDAGADLAVGETGELCVRGPQVMAGYWNRPDETEKVMTPDGFLRTGDMAVVDERGFVHLVDRKKDMIIVSGFNVYPAEIEEVVGAHPGVLEAGAVGVPDANGGEAVKIVVVRKDPELDAATLLAYCREHLTRYKVPRRVEFRDRLPKTSVGKILRRELREDLAA
ncbi:MAG TPA: AMP-binding protein [Burkholderiaceae bacterium]|nr:AMP-binding protein [Burkholderiaceae bacterium]